MPLFTKRKVADGQDALLIGKGKEKGDEYGTIDNDSMGDSDAEENEKLEDYPLFELNRENGDQVKQEAGRFTRVDDNIFTRKSEKAKEKNEKNKSTSKPRSLRDLYRFSTPFDAILITFGVLGSIANGAGMPLMAIIFGGMSNTFIKIEKITQSGSADNFTLFSSTMPSLNSGLEEFNQNVITYSIYYVYMGLGILVVAYVQTACWMITCERQIHKIRKQFLKSILRQEIAWFDQKQTGELTAQLSGNLDRIKEGIGDKFGILVQYLTQMVTGYVIAFVYNWKLTLVMMALAPVMLGLGIAVWKVLSAISKREHTEYAAAGAIADQVLSCIKTVMAFNGQKQEHARYEKALEEAKKTGIKRGLFQGVSIGVIMLSIFGSYSLALWYGAKLIVWKELDPGTVFIVLMSVMSGSQSLGNISPQFAVLAAAKSGAASIFDIIDAKPTIDPYSTSGRKLEKPMGKIQFSNVKFAYPTRKEVTVLKDVSFSVDSGQCVAVVGSSGSGKSTIVSLLLRYYDVDAGRVSIDGENIKNLNLHWLRRLIAVVSQEPVLFDATIEENIRFGRMDVSRTEIIHAAQMANAHDFISSLPEAYRTRVGERGTQLSGGQKQRIAIARALVRRPKILLLDEATSALDAESESLVQEALDLARQGRTTIVIAHRLSTIRNADKIVAIKDGQLYETGTHDELMSKKGLYYDLVTAQTFDTIAPENIMVSEEDDVFLNGAENGPDASAAALVRRTSSTRRTASRSGYMSGSEPESGSARRLSRMLSRGVETEKERLEREAKEEQAEKSTVLAIMKENKPEWWAITLGLVGATIRGAGFPLFSLFYSQMFAVYTKEDDILLSESNFWALMMVAMGLVMALGDVISSSCFGISSENLTMRLRLKTFQNILRQDAAYFDNPAHVTGKLCTRLATDAAMIKGAVDQRMSTILTSVVSMVAGIVVGMLYSWELTLLMLLILPLFALGMYVRFKVRIRRGAENRDGLLLEAAGQTASEAIENIRTVQALTREIPVYETFCRYLQTPYKQALRHTQSHAISYAFSQCIIFFFYAACFRFGAYLVMQGKLGPMDIFKVFFVIMFSGMTVGWATAYFPEMMKARIAAGLIMKMINERPRIDNCSNAGLKSDYTGSVTFDAVYFLYPSRPNSHVLRGLSFQVSPGRTVALVGASGCGKSTIVNLIERFYDPTDGRILIDNQDLKTMNLQSSRDQMALVSQEPTLFDCSIYDNILYGTTGIEHERVIEAARLANIHEFVMGLPEGYATRVGEKGVQLSGGQKQRIAIARALVRNPKILLLDEATSALDTESEKLVQDALDKARRGRTCIMIAHRLSTIQNADRIFVLKNGRIVEEGSHMELVNARGPYYELTKRQHKPH